MEESKGYRFWRETLNSAKLIVAPMVDQSELAWRLLSRRYGAQLCYTPMLHASVFIRDAAYRRDALTTCPEDQPLIAQFCANDPDILLKAAKYAEETCLAVDLNLGCPQAIARRGHYGAFLQDEWDLLERMISTCAKGLTVPITAKIRVFDDLDKTVRYAQMLERAGCQILTVHGRTKEQRGIHTGLASWEYIKAVKEAVKIPVFANGNIQYSADVGRCMEETGVDGVMTAEGNLHNPGLFDGKEHHICDMAFEYLDIVEQYPCPMSYVRGHLFKMMHHALQIHTSVRDLLSTAKNLSVFKEGVRLLQQCIQEDMKKYTENPDSLGTKLPLPYWICQPYVRPDPEEAKDKTRTKRSNRDEELEQLKRSLSMRGDVMDEQEMSRKKLKKILRNNKKLVRKKHNQEKFPQCGCGNAKGLRCVFQCCKSCCKVRALKENKACPAHKVQVKNMTGNTQDSPIPGCNTTSSATTVTTNSVNTNSTEVTGVNPNCDSVANTHKVHVKNMTGNTRESPIPGCNTISSATTVTTDSVNTNSTEVTGVNPNCDSVANSVDCIPTQEIIVTDGYMIQ